MGICSSKEKRALRVSSNIANRPPTSSNYDDKSSSPLSYKTTRTACSNSNSSSSSSTQAVPSSPPPRSTPTSTQAQIHALLAKRSAIETELADPTWLASWSYRRDKAALEKDVAYSKYRKQTVCGNRQWVVYQAARVRHEEVLAELRDRKHEMRGIELEVRRLKMGLGEQAIDKEGRMK